MRLALALIVKASDDEAVCLARLLRENAQYFDGIFITITGENEAVKRVAEKYNAHISHFKWINSFAAARNYNFSQVPKDFDYIMWLDADDTLQGGEKLRSTIEANLEVDCFSLFYYYAFDDNNNPIIVHQKTQIVRNDGCVEWRGRLHEDFHENRELKVFFIKGIERIHLSNDHRINANKKRNVEVAEEDYLENSTDPRTYWNYGKALMGDSQYDKALEIFTKFIAQSGSEEEKYLVRMDLVDIYLGQGKPFEALEQAQVAIGMRPEYPNGYYKAARVYEVLNRHKEAAASYFTGLTKKPPYFTIIVYNPREYDYIPMMNLARVYFALNRADLALPLIEGCLQIYPNDKVLKDKIEIIRTEAKKCDEVNVIIAKLNKLKRKSAIEKVLNEMPVEFRQHPAVCHFRNTHEDFIKKTSSGKDLVIYCGMTNEDWTPQTAIEKGIGGSEEAIIHLGQRFADAGYNVTVYNSCGHMDQQFGGVLYKPWWSYNYRDRQDITILWRSPLLTDYEINSGKVFVDLHDVIKSGEFTEKRLKRIDKIFVKTKAHRDLFPNVPDDKFSVIPNGIDSSVFSQDVRRDPHLIINTSSPDRSITALIKGFKIVKEAVPQAKCKWAYGWGVFDSAHGDSKEKMEWKDKVKADMRDVGIEEMGRVSHGEVARLYQEACIFGYPTSFFEIHCISACKAQAGGAIPVTTDFAALEETVQFGYKIHSNRTKDDWCKDYQFDFSLDDEFAVQKWAEKCIEVLQSPPNEEDRNAMREWAREKYDWDRVAQEWISAMV